MRPVCYLHRVSFLFIFIILFLYDAPFCFFFFFQAEDGIRDVAVTGVQTCALPISVSSRQIRCAPRRASFFYPGPVLPDPLAHAAIVALLRARLRPLGTEAARPQQPTDVIRMIDDLELVADDIDDPPARPQARGIASRFRPRHDHAHQLTPLRRAQLRRTARRGARAQAVATPSPVRALPPAGGAPVPTQPPRPHQHRGLTPEGFHPA